MATIYTRKGESILVDDADADWLSRFKWYLAEGYPYTWAHGRTISMHRLIMAPPAGMVVDHINRDRRDNRRSNLRVTTSSENNRNRAPQCYILYDKPTAKWWLTRGRELIGMYHEESDAKRARLEARGDNMPSVTNTTIPVD